MSRWKDALLSAGIALVALLVVFAGVITINALSGTPAPATAPCVAPSPPVAVR